MTAGEMEITLLNQMLQQKSAVFQAWEVGAEFRSRLEIKAQAVFDLTQADLAIGNPKDGRTETFEDRFGTQHKPYSLMGLAVARNMRIL
jgi:hypothetical protein